MTLSFQFIILIFRKISAIELFAGAGGLALGLEKAGFEHVFLNEFNQDAFQTLKQNRPQWDVSSQDVSSVNFSKFKNKVDFISGGFPCQAFSHSGKRLGLEDSRGTLFYEFGRSIQEIKPKFFLAENVKGLLTHDKGNTYDIISNSFKSLGYHVFPPLLLNSNNYEVAQKRERIFIFGCLPKYKSKIEFNNPPKIKPLILKDIFLPGKYYDKNISEISSNHPKYSSIKEKLFALIPPGGNWKDLPKELQIEYLGSMYYSGGGKTGVLKRLSMDLPSPTILTNPSQKQTERCHPEIIRPVNIREAARIQSFPDNWDFFGSISSQYKQIGNAVPPNLAFHVGKYLYGQIKEII